MRVAVSSSGTSLDAWIAGPFGACSQFLVVDTETMEYMTLSVPAEQLDSNKVSLPAIRALAQQGVEVVITGQIKEICRQTMDSLGMEVIDGAQGITARDAVALYISGGPQAVADYAPGPSKIAVASHGDGLEATLSPKGEACTSFVLVDPETMEWEVVRVKPADTPERASVNAVRAAARSGATVVITPEIRPVCCEALRALAVAVALADEKLTVREAVEAYRRGELTTPAYT